MFRDLTTFAPLRTDNIFLFFLFRAHNISSISVGKSAINENSIQYFKMIKPLNRIMYDFKVAQNTISPELILN